MDLEIIIVSEVSQTRERQVSPDIAYVWNMKNLHKWTYLQNWNRFTDSENKLMITKGEGGRDKLGIFN